MPLAESKNGAIVRKHLGYSHIPQRFAPLINTFNQYHLNPYIMPLAPLSPSALLLPDCDHRCEG